MRSSILIILCFIGLQSHAGTREDAYKICQQLPFQSDRDTCVQGLRRYHYFDNGALDICNSLTFTSDKVSCLPIIGDKEYESYEIKNCVGQTFPSDKVNCLRNSGAPVQLGSCADKNMVLSYLRGAKFDLGQGQANEVDAKLNYLINVFESCRAFKNDMKSSR